MMLMWNEENGLPVVTDDYYALGEFETAVLADFNEDADRIDEKYRSGADSSEYRTVSADEERQTGIDAMSIQWK